MPVWNRADRAEKPARVDLKMLLGDTWSRARLAGFGGSVGRKLLVRYPAYAECPPRRVVPRCGGSRCACDGELPARGALRPGAFGFRPCFDIDLSSHERVPVSNSCRTSPLHPFIVIVIVSSRLAETLARRAAGF
jgi:hypothetical protein